MRLLALRRWFTQKSGNNSKNEYSSLMVDLVRERRQDKIQIRKELELQSLNNKRKIMIQEVHIKMYFSHESPYARYVEAIMNYQQIGFTVYHDRAHMKMILFAMKLLDLPDSERWPFIKVQIGELFFNLRKEEVIKFFSENKYFLKSIDYTSGDIQAIQEHIDLRILPHMERLFWHPLLTLKATTIYSTESLKHAYAFYKQYFYYNLTPAFKMVLRNSYNMFAHREDYLRSKPELTKALKELAELYMKEGKLIGGQRPNHADFYLFGWLRTRSHVRVFADYLMNDISRDFRSWWITMSSLCRHNPEIVTIV